MEKTILKDIHFRIHFHNVLHFKLFEKIISSHFFFYSIYEMNKLKIKSALCKIRNRCLYNGKSRSVFKKFRLSRYNLKFFSSNGLLTGIVKY